MKTIKNVSVLLFLGVVAIATVARANGEHLGSQVISPGGATDLSSLDLHSGTGTARIAHTRGTFEFTIPQQGSAFSITDPTSFRMLREWFDRVPEA